MINNRQDDGKVGTIIACRCCREQVSHIAAGTRNPGHATLGIEDGIQFLLV